MNILGDITDPKKDAAAIEPFVKDAVAKLVDAVQTLFDGYTITIAITVNKRK